MTEEGDYVAWMGDVLQLDDARFHREVFPLGALHPEANGGFEVLGPIRHAWLQQPQADLVLLARPVDGNVGRTRRDERSSIKTISRA